MPRTPHPHNLVFRAYAEDDLAHQNAPMRPHRCYLVSATFNYITTVYRLCPRDGHRAVYSQSMDYIHAHKTVLPGWSNNPTMTEIRPPAKLRRRVFMAVLTGLFIDSDNDPDPERTRQLALRLLGQMPKASRTVGWMKHMRTFTAVLASSTNGASAFRNPIWSALCRLYPRVDEQA